LKNQVHDMAVSGLSTLVWVSVHFSRGVSSTMGATNVVGVYSVGDLSDPCGVDVELV